MTDKFEWILIPEARRTGVELEDGRYVALFADGSGADFFAYWKDGVSSAEEFYTHLEDAGYLFLANLPEHYKFWGEDDE